MKSFLNPIKTQPLLKFVLISSSFCAISLCLSVLILATPKILDKGSSPQHVYYDATTVDHLVFGIASSEKSWPKRKQYAKLWWNLKPNKRMRGCAFVDNLPHEENSNNNDDGSVPPLCVSEDTSQFLYTYRPGGLRSAIRVARVVKETVALNFSDVRWYVFGDDDTIFFPENLVKTLSKYDHRLWYYVGSFSEIYEGSQVFGFGMAFGGGGFAVSSSLAQVLAKVFDSCLQRYPHLYGSDARVYSCITELGVGLTHEPGFHQVDLRGNIFGLLAAHPLTPLLSLHHPDHTDPIFPNVTTANSMQHLFEAVNVDSQRVLQQTVCYDRQLSWTISVSWGYAVQVFQANVLLPEVLRVEKTFKQWKEGNVLAGIYTFNTREQQPDPCKRPTIFYMDEVSSGKDGTGIISSYRKSFQNCSHKNDSLKKLEVIKVMADKLDLDSKQTPRRQCCDVLASNSGALMEIAIRECKYEELIHMQ